MNARIIPVFVPHLGCPCDCVFCNQRSIAAPREPSPSEVADIIAEGVARAGKGAELAFYGGSFTAIDKAKRVGYLAAAQPFIKNGSLSGIRISTRPDCISAEILDELAAFGVRTIELGAQSMDNRVLLLSNRGHTAEDTVVAARLVKSRGFRLVLQMMIGLPGEENHMGTVNEIAELKPDGVRIYPVVVIKNTRLEELYRSGEYLSLTPERGALLAGEALEYFENSCIAVIRVGLNPTEELSGEVVAGAYHPALGEMARSAVFLKRAREKLADFSGGSVLVAVGLGKTSMMVGQRRRNIEILTSEFRLKSIRITEKTELIGYEIEILPV